MPSPWTLRRSADDAKLAGLCGGLAQRWQVDPVLVRVGVVLLALTGGIGAVLYLAGWLLLPVAGSDRAPVDDLLGGAGARWPRELWVTLVVVACVLSFTVLGGVSPFGLAPALALLALWWFGFQRPRARRRRAAEQQHPTAQAPYAVGPTVPASPVTWSGPSTPFTEAAAAWQARVAAVRNGDWISPAFRQADDATWDPVPTAPPAPVPYAPAQASLRSSIPTVPLEPAPLGTAPLDPAPLNTAPFDPEAQARAAFLAEPDPVGLYTEPAPVPVVRPGATLAARRLRLGTLVALGLTWLGLGIADGLGVPVSLAVYAASGLLVLAVGLLAATRLGRARGLLPAGLVLAAAAVLTSGFLAPALAEPARQAGHLVEHPVVYTSAAAFPAGGDRVDFGDLEVDLTGLALQGDATYRATVNTGRVVVRTPPGTGVALRYAVDTGDVQAYGSQVGGGTEVDGERLLVPPAAGQPTLTLDLTVDTGSVEVR